MNRSSLLLPFISAALTLSTSGQIAVTDPSQLAQSERHHVQAALQRSEMIAKQMEEIRQLTKQVAQMETQLRRQGDPAKTVEIQGAQALERSLTTSATVPLPTPSTSPTHTPISEQVLVEGEARGLRDGAAYRPERAFEHAFARYQQTRETVFARRAELRGAMLETTRSLKAAQSDSEVQKLLGVLLGLQAELQTLTHELDAANQDVLLQFYQNENHRQLETKAKSEDESQALRDGVRQMISKLVTPMPLKPQR